MANPEHLAILKQGVEQWNRWRKESVFLVTSPDLESSDLRRENLIGVDLGETNLRGADLRQLLLNGADFTGADLHGTDLREANLGWANFRRANLAGCNLTDARVGLTIFADVDLSVARGLEAIEHYLPSTVGIDTIYKSRGKIPEVFLRGCGVPEEFIAYVGSMVGRPIEFYSCFISYSSQDQEFADRLYADLQAKGVRCWFAPHDIQGGRKIHEQLDEAIRLRDKLLLILSPNSMGSNWVRTEIANAREQEEREKKQMLFPITLAPFEEVRKWKLPDGDTGLDSARVVREYYIPDFSNWKDHDSYQKAFERLVRDLKAKSS